MQNRIPEQGIKQTESLTCSTTKDYAQPSMIKYINQ